MWCSETGVGKTGVGQEEGQLHGSAASAGEAAAGAGGLRRHCHRTRAARR